MLVGFHVEGYDYLVLKALLAKLLGLAESSISADPDEPRVGMGWQQVLDTLPLALKRFYARCCALAVVGIDNDGNLDLVASGAAEDPARPRHWLHAGATEAKCRHCQVDGVIQRVRPELTWIPNKPGHAWPIVVCVPVEMIESWLLVARAITNNGGSLHAERERRSGQKQRMYGRPEATREDVESVALPLIRALTPKSDVDTLRRHSKSFDAFAAAVLRLDPATLAAPCWR
jgi:hypothetical protein